MLYLYKRKCRISGKGSLTRRKDTGSKSAINGEDGKEWLPRRDSNPNKQNQNLRCYHYTTRQSRVLSKMAGSTGLEPATPGSTVQCANQLRHNPVSRKRGIVYHNRRTPCKGVSENYWTKLR